MVRSKAKEYTISQTAIYTKVPLLTIIGFFKEGAREGRGRYKWNDNSFYDGEWKGDKMHGRGMYSSAEGVVTEGYF